MLDGIYQFDDARRIFKFRNFYGIVRMSTPSQAGTGGSKLKAADAVLSTKLQEAAPTRFQETFTIVESGKLIDGKKKYKEAVKKAAGGILVGVSLRDFLRPDMYDRQTNRNAPYLRSEIEGLLAISPGVVLATILPPEASESERMSVAIRRNGNAGRKSKFDKWKVLTLLGTKTNGEYEMSYRDVAARCEHCSKDSIVRFLKQPVPSTLAEFPGECWGDLKRPIEIFDRISRSAVSKLYEGQKQCVSKLSPENRL